MQPAMTYIGEKPLDPLTLYIYPSGRSSYTLYEDDGLTLAYQRGTFATTLVTVDARTGRMEIQVERPLGPFRVAPRRYEFRVHLDGAPASVRIDGTITPRINPPDSGATGAASWWFDRSARTLVIMTDAARKAREVRVEVDR